jgi:hypothetical protein
VRIASMMTGFFISILRLLNSIRFYFTTSKIMTCLYGIP